MSVSLGLFLSTFVLEDVALGVALALIAQGKLSFLEAFLICFSGITLGDFGLYYLGKYASMVPYLQKKIDAPSFQLALRALRENNKIDAAVVISRAVPGTRIPTYIGAGLLGFSRLRFLILTALSVSGWVLCTLYFGLALLSPFKDHLLLALLSFFILLYGLKQATFFFQNSWQRRAALHAWRRWLHFEFWPSQIFYLPIVPYYIYLSLRHGSFLLPFYAGNAFKHGGLIGESKWDFLKHLSPDASATLPAIMVKEGEAMSEIRQKLTSAGIDFPLIAKPDVGQRGFGVRVIATEGDLDSYLRLSAGAVILQRKSQFGQEAGVFYIRLPTEERGFIFSVTDKEFPFVVGDGESRLGDLILRDPRARIIAAVYFERHKAKLDFVLPPSQRFYLSECGNHCQGAVFLNGKDLASPELLGAIEGIAHGIPGFFFGRVDLRYKDAATLKNGREFEIIEVNGAGSEATHIWDSKTTLAEAYGTLFQQWQYLFRIGALVKKQGACRGPELGEFIVECARVYFRRGALKTSS